MNARQQVAPEVHQEPDEIASRTIAAAAVASIAIGASGVLFAGLVLVTTTGALRPRAGPRSGAPTPGGVEQTPLRDTQVGIDVHDRQRAELEVYRWMDRDGGIAAIPIDRAIDLFVERSR